jgi:hypothetical protein
MVLTIGSAHALRSGFTRVQSRESSNNVPARADLSGRLGVSAEEGRVI